MTNKEKLDAFKKIMEGVSNLNDICWRLDDMGYFTAPASTKYHGAYEGGLFDHSLTVAETLEDLTTQNYLWWGRAESPIIIGMFHDLCKCDGYLKDGDGWIYNPNPMLTGHGDKSVMLASTLMQLTMEEVLCIRYHMGAFTEKSEWPLYGRAVEEYPNVLWTHQADMIAAKIKKV